LSSQVQRLYWALLTLLGSLIGYEAVASQVYGDNSFYLAVVFFGVAALSLRRLVSVGRAAAPEERTRRLRLAEAGLL
jgi:hypothetical protein